MYYLWDRLVTKMQIIGCNILNIQGRIFKGTPKISRKMQNFEGIDMSMPQEDQYLIHASQ